MYALCRCRRVDARIHLEVDVRPATRVRRREDARERDLTVGVGLLNAAEVVLVGDALGVHRVEPVAVAVPEVHRGACERGAPVGGVDEVEGDRQRHAVGHSGRGADAGRDVAAHDAALAEHVRPVGAVAGIRPGGLAGNRLAGDRLAPLSDATAASAALVEVDSAVVAGVDARLTPLPSIRPGGRPGGRPASTIAVSSSEPQAARAPRLPPTTSARHAPSGQQAGKVSGEAAEVVVIFACVGVS